MQITTRASCKAAQFLYLSENGHNANDLSLVSKNICEIGAELLLQLSLIFFLAAAIIPVSFYYRFVNLRYVNSEPVTMFTHYAETSHLPAIQSAHMS